MRIVNYINRLKEGTPERRTKAYYDHSAWFYDEFICLSAVFDHVRAESERGKLIEYLEIKKGQSILEVAVGTGSNFQIIASRFGGEVNLAGIDISDRMLNQCKKKFTRYGIKATLIQGNAAFLPFQADYFDTVFHFGGFNNFQKKPLVLQEIMRVTKPGGVILISDKSLANQDKSLRQKLLLRMEPQLADPPPADLIPLPRSALELAWFWGNNAYILKFRKPIAI